MLPCRLLGCLTVLLTAAVGYAACDPTSDPDKSDIANARAAVASNCDCAGATSHGAYVSCAMHQANTVLVNKSCARFVRRCASRSVCGKGPTAVTCCLTTGAGTKCKTKKDAAHCTAKQGAVGSCTSCCDACPPPGGGPSCPMSIATTTTTTTTSSCPPATAAYCGAADCGEGGMPSCDPSFNPACPQGMTCVTTGTTCGCAGTAIPCGDPRLSGLTCNFCKWGTCPAGMTCGGVRKTDGCGFDCACQPANTTTTTACPTTTTLGIPDCSASFCSGPCRSGQACSDLGNGACGCAGPILCGGAYNVCGGACSNGQSCTQISVPAGCPSIGCECQ